jgi:ribosomal protein S18 acetylase RimI-like enzyme
MSNEPRENRLLRVIDNPDRDDVQFLDDRLYEYNVSATGLTDGRLLAIFVRDAGGSILAGIYGWTWGGCCEIKTLWVREDQRHRGLGARLMAAAEAEARARGAVQMVLSTHSFQAPDFYRRLGFETVGAFGDYPRGHRNIFLRKQLR